MHIPLLPDIIVILGLAIVVLLITAKLKIPSIVGFLITGFIAGPYGLGLVQEAHQVEMLAEVGVVLLLFTIGIEFSLGDLVKIKKTVLLGGTIQVFGTIGLVWVIGMQLGFSSTLSLTAGILLATSSTAIILKSLQERNEINSNHGKTALGILIYQDIIIVPLMLILPFLAGSDENLAQSLGLLVLKGVGIVVIALLAARFVMPYLLFQVARTRKRELFILTIVATCMVIAGATATLGLSLGLGAFLAGLVISESEYSHQAMAGILPLKDVFTSIFFVSIGMLLDMQFVFDQPGLVFGTAIGVLFLKAIIIGITGLVLRLPIRTLITSAIILSQVGEFGFILAGVAFGEELLSLSYYQLFLASSVLTMLATPALISYGPKLGIFIGKKFDKLDTKRQHTSSDQIDTQKLNDHLIIVGYGVNGRNLARAARLGSIPYIILEMNPDTVKEERKKGEPIYFGDATNASVLEHVSISTARVMVVAISDAISSRSISAIAKELHPGIYLIVRTRLISEMNPLYRIGADEVIPEEFETSIEIFTRVLVKYLIPRQDIEGLTNDIRSDRYDMLRSPKVKGKMTDLNRYFSDVEITTVKLFPNSWLVGKTLSELSLRKLYNVTLLAIRIDSEITSNPAPDIPLQGDCDLVLMGSIDSIRRFLTVLPLTDEPESHEE